MATRILITDKLAQEGIDLINSIDGVEAVVNLGISEDELASIIGEYDGLIIRSGTTVTAKVLENSGKLKGIARAGVGVDNIDIPAATRKGVIVMNTPGGNTLSAAEHTMALMLAMSRNVVPACNSLKEGKWDRKKYMGNQLNNKTLGLIGLGRIGMAVAKMAAGFGMNVLGYDPIASPPDAQAKGVEVTEDLEKLFKESDFISVHVPRNEQTIDMISTEQLKMMKPSVRLVNCARGGIINEAAAYAALEKGEIAGVALDVFPTEPPENTGFAGLGNCVVTPHLGASTTEAQIEVAVEAAQILSDAITGGSIKNALNAPSTSGTVAPIVVMYGQLARKIGEILSTIAVGKIKSVNVKYCGAIAEMDTQEATLNFTIGLLQKHFEMPLNTVNATIMAKERGIGIDETKNTSPVDVSSSFTATVVTDKVTRTVVGTVFGGSKLRIIAIDGFDVELTPSDTVILIYNADKPGVIGDVGTICGKYAINIGTMGVGQKIDKSEAVLAVSLDKMPSDELVDELKKLDFVTEVYICKLS